jgi:hypothetical protein
MRKTAPPTPTPALHVVNMDGCGTRQVSPPERPKNVASVIINLAKWDGGGERAVCNSSKVQQTDLAPQRLKQNKKVRRGDLRLVASFVITR